MDSQKGPTEHKGDEWDLFQPTIYWRKVPILEERINIMTEVIIPTFYN